jgi:hypothetical protein
MVDYERLKFPQPVQLLHLLFVALLKVLELHHFALILGAAALWSVRWFSYAELGDT